MVDSRCLHFLMQYTIKKCWNDTLHDFRIEMLIVLKTMEKKKNVRCSNLSLNLWQLFSGAEIISKTDACTNGRHDFFELDVCCVPFTLKTKYPLY